MHYLLGSLCWVYYSLNCLSCFQLKMLQSEKHSSVFSCLTSSPVFNYFAFSKLSTTIFIAYSPLYDFRWVVLITSTNLQLLSLIMSHYPLQHRYQPWKAPAQLTIFCFRRSHQISEKELLLLLFCCCSKVTLENLIVFLSLLILDCQDYSSSA